MEVDCTLNGTDVTFTATGAESLLAVLRRAGYTGAKRGCDTGDCGFCTVIVDGDPIKSCVHPVARVDGATVETIEGLGTQDDLHPVQAAFVDNAALQCGFCIPGMIMRTKGLLDETPDPTEAEIRAALSGNFCRCTGYEKIVDAVEDAASRTDPQAATDGGRRDADARSCTDCGCRGDDG
jgi:carbon-monoxide dehydrogenase small subunit